MGIDGTRIWNKEGKLNVRHPFRLITTVHSCEVLPDPFCFSIVFEEEPKMGLGKNELVKREYRTDTQVDCAEIVAKIQFLMKHQPKS